MEPHPSEQDQPKPSGGCGKFVIGCGIVLLILVIILAVAGWFVAKNLRGWTASGVAAVVNQAVEQSTLPEDQKQAITDRINEVKEDFAAGDLTLEEFGKAMENLQIENLIAAGLAQFVGTGIIETSQLPEEDRAAGKAALNRVAHGLLDGQIDMAQVETALAPIMQNPGSGDWQFKTNPTEEELRQLMENATDLADQAGVPPDVAEVDFAARVNEAFDQALGVSPDPAEAPDENTNP